MGGGVSKNNPDSPAAKAALLLRSSPIFFCFTNDEGSSTKEQVAAMSLIASKFKRVKLSAGATCKATEALVSANGSVEVGLKDLSFVEFGHFVLKQDGVVPRTIRQGEIILGSIGEDGIRLVAATDVRVLSLLLGEYEELRTMTNPAVLTWLSHMKDLCLTYSRPAVELIRESRVFSDDGFMVSMGRIAHYRSFAAGEVIIERGCVSDHCYILASGSVEVTPEVKTPEVIPEAKTLQVVGTFFGETSLAQLDTSYALPATATVTAAVDCVVLAFAPEELRLLMLPEVVEAQVHILLKDRMMSEVSLGPLLHSFDKQEIREFTKMASYHLFHPGAEVFCEGDLGDDFFIVLHGEVQISTLKGLDVRLQNRGDFFGELALIRQSPRLATVRALDTVALAKIKGAQFRQFFMSSELFAAEFEIKAMRKNVSVDAVIAHPRTSEPFKEVCIGSFLLECFECYNDLREYRVMKGPPEAKAKEIYATYLDPETSGDSCVTISDKTLKVVREALYDDNDTLVDAEFLRDAAREVAENLTGALRKFVQSPAYDVVLTDLGAYSQLKTTSTDKKKFSGSHGARRVGRFVLPSISPRASKPPKKQGSAMVFFISKMSTRSSLTGFRTPRTSLTSSSGSQKRASLLMSPSPKRSSLIFSSPKAAVSPAVSPSAAAAEDAPYAVEVRQGDSTS